MTSHQSVCCHAGFHNQRGIRTIGSPVSMWFVCDNCHEPCNIQLAEVIDDEEIPRGRKPRECPGACCCVAVCGIAVINGLVNAYPMPHRPTLDPDKGVQFRGCTF